MRRTYQSRGRLNSDLGAVGHLKVSVNLRTLSESRLAHLLLADMRSVLSAAAKVLNLTL